MKKSFGVQKQRQLKKKLPNELYINAKEGKRGQGELVKSINTRLTAEEYKELLELLNNLGVERSVFIRYAIAQLKTEVEKIVKEHEEGK